MDSVGQRVRLRLLADDGGQDRRCEDTDAVDAQVLQEPWNRGQDRRATVSLLEQCQVAPVTFGGLGYVAQVSQRHALGILRGALEQFGEALLPVGGAALRHQPVRALRDVQASDDDKDCRHDRRCVHHPPCAQVRVRIQDAEAQRGAEERSDGLEREGAQHQSAPHRGCDALRDHHVRGRVVTAQRDSGPEQTDDQRDEVGGECQRHQEHSEDNHLRDEHRLAPICVRQTTEGRGTDQDAR